LLHLYESDLLPSSSEYPLKVFTLQISVKNICLNALNDWVTSFVSGSG